MTIVDLENLSGLPEQSIHVFTHKNEESGWEKWNLSKQFVCTLVYTKKAKSLACNNLAL